MTFWVLEYVNYLNPLSLRNITICYKAYFIIIIFTKPLFYQKKKISHRD